MKLSTKIPRRRFLATTTATGMVLALPRVLTAQKSEKQLVIRVLVNTVMKFSIIGRNYRINIPGKRHITLLSTKMDCSTSSMKDVRT